MYAYILLRFCRRRWYCSVLFWFCHYSICSRNTKDIVLSYFWPKTSLRKLTNSATWLPFTIFTLFHSICFNTPSLPRGYYFLFYLKLRLFCCFSEETFLLQAVINYCKTDSFLVRPRSQKLSISCFEDSTLINGECDCRLSSFKLK